MSPCDTDITAGDAKAAHAAAAAAAKQEIIFVRSILQDLFSFARIISIRIPECDIPINETDRGRRPVSSLDRLQDDYFIIAAATFLNALMSASMWARVYVGCVQNEIVESASECATEQLNFV